MLNVIIASRINLYHNQMKVYVFTPAIHMIILLLVVFLVCQIIAHSPLLFFYPPQYLVQLLSSYKLLLSFLFTLFNIEIYAIESTNNRLLPATTSAAIVNQQQLSTTNWFPSFGIVLLAATNLLMLEWWRSLSLSDLQMFADNICEVLCRSLIRSVLASQKRIL